jgi:hypothetical protein
MALETDVHILWEVRVVGAKEYGAGKLVFKAEYPINCRPCVKSN